MQKGHSSRSVLSVFPMMVDTSGGVSLQQNACRSLKSLQVWFVLRIPAEGVFMIPQAVASGQRSFGPAPVCRHTDRPFAAFGIYILLCCDRA